MAISASQGYQIAELLEVALKDMPSMPVEEPSDRIHVAIVGRPNVGKSTLINYLLQEQRCVVSPIPGTTRDSVDVDIEVRERYFLPHDRYGGNPQKKIGT